MCDQSSERPGGLLGYANLASSSGRDSERFPGGCNHFVRQQIATLQLHTPVRRHAVKTHYKTAVYTYAGLNVSTIKAGKDGEIYFQPGQGI